jgi:hypothetical protein
MKLIYRYSVIPNVVNQNINFVNAEIEVVYARLLPD